MDCPVCNGNLQVTDAGGTKPCPICSSRAAPANVPSVLYCIAHMHHYSVGEGCPDCKGLADPREQRAQAWQEAYKKAAEQQDQEVYRKTMAQHAKVAIDDLSRRRWETVSGTSNHKPETALRAALDALLTGKKNFKHVIVIYATTENEGEDILAPVGWYQAGELEHFGQVGLIDTAKFIMHEDYGN